MEYNVQEDKPMGIIDRNGVSKIYEEEFADKVGKYLQISDEPIH